MKKATLTLAALALVSACSTIEVGHGPTGDPTGEVYSYWHHNFAFSLYEASSPVNLSNCESSWNTLVIEKDLITALAGSIDNAILVVDVWDPWRARLYCSPI